MFFLLGFLGIRFIDLDNLNGVLAITITIVTASFAYSIFLFVYFLSDSAEHLLDVLPRLRRHFEQVSFVYPCNVLPVLLRDAPLRVQIDLVPSYHERARRPVISNLPLDRVYPSLNIYIIKKKKKKKKKK